MRSKRRRRLRSYRWLSITLLVLIGLSGTGTAIGYLGLKPRIDALQASLAADLEAGQSALEAGKTALTQASSKHDPALVTQANADFVSANGHFMAASHLADTSGLLHYAQLTPGLSEFALSRHTAVDGIAQMGAGIANAGLAVTSLYSQLVKPQPTSPNVLTVLNEVQAAVPTLRDDLLGAQAGASQVDPQVLPSGQQAAFVKARGTISSGLAGLDELDRLTPVLTDVFGGNGPRTYLVQQVNPAELRAGGGFIGTYSLIHAAQGHVALTKSGNAYDLADPRPMPGQPGFIPQPSPYRETAPGVSWSFVDSNIYPDFPSNAKVAETFAEPRLGTVDGVITIDYYTVAEMLSLTGPITIPGLGTLTASNFISSLIPLDIVNSSNHKALVGAVADVLMQRLVAFPPAGWPNLIIALDTLAAQRHLQAYFNNAMVEAEVTRVGWSGIVRPTGSADFMMEVEANYWGNKDNYFLTRSYSVVLTKIGGSLHHQVTVRLINATDCASNVRPAYRANLRLFVADTAQSLSDNLRGDQYANPLPPPGTVAADGWAQDVDCGGGVREAVFTYDTSWIPDAHGLDQVYWQKQPGIFADAIAVTWNSGDGHSYTAGGSLDQDRIIDLSATGISLVAGQPGQVSLPTLSLG